MNTSRLISRILLAAAALPVLVAAQAPTPPPTRVEWSAEDLSGTAVQVPAADAITVLLYVRARHPQSQQITEAAGKTCELRPDVRAIVIVSGVDAPANAKKLHSDLAFDFPVVADPEYALSGAARVRVWPTTLIVARDGAELARLAGAPRSFEREFVAHLDHALGKINDDQLKQQLSDTTVVMDQPQHVAQRHVMVAQRLIEKGDFDMARGELETAVKLSENDPAIKLLLADVLIRQDKPTEAAAQLDAIPAAAAPAWQLQVLRAKIQIAQGQWDQAKATLAGDAIHLNPHPAEAYYLSGLVHEHFRDLPAAARAYRKAYESTTRRSGPKE